MRILFLAVFVARGVVDICEKPFKPGAATKEQPHERCAVAAAFAEGRFNDHGSFC